MVNVFVHLQFLLLIATVSSATGGHKCASDKLNTCMSLIPEYSKERSGPEPNTECPIYKDRSCCRAGVTTPFETSNQWQNITKYNHCPEKSSLGGTCHQRFFEELCFFLCSPDIGPWIVRGEPSSVGTILKDRFVNVPLCSSVCNAWYSACKSEYTCAENWYTDFNVDAQGLNVCKEGSTCDTYENVFRNASNFCEMIWDNSFKVVPDDQPCMMFAFKEDTKTNNQHVAQTVAQSMAKRNAAGN